MSPELMWCGGPSTCLDGVKGVGGERMEQYVYVGCVMRVYVE